MKRAGMRRLAKGSKILAQPAQHGGFVKPRARLYYLGTKTAMLRRLILASLECSGQNAIIFSRKGLFQGYTRRNIKKLYIFNSFYLLDSCNQSLKWSFLGVKKRLGHAQIGLLQGFNSKFPRSISAPFIWKSPPRGNYIFFSVRSLGWWSPVR